MNEKTQWQFFGIIHFLFLNLYDIFYNIRKKVWFSPKFFDVIDFFSLFDFVIALWDLILHSEIYYCTLRKNMGFIHSELTNQITDIFCPRDNVVYQSIINFILNPKIYFFNLINYSYQVIDHYLCILFCSFLTVYLLIFRIIDKI